MVESTDRIIGNRGHLQGEAASPSRRTLQDDGDLQGSGHQADNRQSQSGRRLVVLGCFGRTVIVLKHVRQFLGGDTDAVVSHRNARRRVIAFAASNFDFPFMSQNSLGAAYDSLSSGQRQEFNQVFSALFQTSYTNMVLRFLKQETVKYGQVSQKGGQTLVKTSLVRTNDTIQVDYLLHQKGGGWLLFDVIVDGVSILDKYKSGFAREIKAGSFQSLMKKMKTQLKAVE